MSGNKVLTKGKEKNIITGVKSLQQQRLFIAIPVLCIIFTALGAVFYFLSYALNPTDFRNKDITPVLLSRGMTLEQLSNKLEEKSIIKNAKTFYWLGKITRQSPRMKVGEYAFSPGDSPLEIFERIAAGKSITYAVTVPEGDNLYQVAASIEAAGLARKDEVISLAKNSEFIKSLKLDNPPPLTLEGYLFPETYSFTRLQSLEEKIEMMVGTFKKYWKKEYDLRAKELGFTRFQVLILASMIEKETGAAEERALISSVFHNRLKKRMKLQSDPTTIYGIWSRFDGNLRKNDLLEFTPYNTYTIPSLPVGPIANPGKDAIQAALHPAESQFLYFVARKNGTHEFTETYEKHLKAVQKYQLQARAKSS